MEMKKISKRLLLLGSLVTLVLVGCGGYIHGESEMKINNSEVVYEDEEIVNEEKAHEGLFTMQRGEWNGDNFHNSYSGIRFELPEGFTALSDDRIHSTIGMGLELSGFGESEQAFVEGMMGTVAVPDVVAASFWGETISIVYFSDIVMLGLSDLQDYLMQQIITREMVFDVEISYDLSEYVLGNEVFQGVLFEYQWGGDTWRELALVRHEGNYIITVSIVSSNIEDLIRIFE